MTFSSPTFLIFLFACTIIYYLLPQKARRIFLLLASYVCYMWAIPAYGLVVLCVTALSYGLARALPTAQGHKKRSLLVAGVLAPLAVLLILKYFGFFADTFAALFGARSLAAPWVAPLGISFFTLQAISYIVDVHSGKLEPEKDFVTFALYISFFPQVFSGPLNRAADMLPQYRAARSFDYANASQGLQRILTGLFKKIVIADALAVLVDGIYGSLSEYIGLTLAVAIVAFALELYFNFAGYSDIAVGAARLLGYALPENFTAPYFATGIAEFWQRWHISLTSWFRDYVYFPIGGSRRGFARKLCNVLIVFALSGLWHGAAWTFVVWGLLNGLYRVAEELLCKNRPCKPQADQGGFARLLRRVAVFALYAFSLVFFRADTFADALYVFRALFSWAPLSVVKEQLWHLSSNGITTNNTYMLFFWGVLFLALLLAFWFDARVNRSLLHNPKQPLCNPVGSFGRTARWLLYWFMGLSTLFFYFIGLTGQRGSASFIYFGF